MSATTTTRNEVGEDELTGEDEEGTEPEVAAGPDDDDELAEDEEGTEPEPEPEPEAQSSETVMRALEKEHGRHAKALRKIMGESFDGYDDCPVCMSMGYVFGSPLADDDTVEVCPNCKGFGIRKTPSLVEQHATRQCFRCMGNGYIDRQTVVEPTPLAAVPAAAPTPHLPPDHPAITELKALGYTVLPPYVPPTTPSA